MDKSRKFGHIFSVFRLESAYQNIVHRWVRDLSHLTSSYREVIVDMRLRCTLSCLGSNPYISICQFCIIFLFNGCGIKTLSGKAWVPPRIRGSSIRIVSFLILYCITSLWVRFQSMACFWNGLFFILTSTCFV